MDLGELKKCHTMHEITGVWLESKVWVNLKNAPLWSSYKHQNNSNAYLTLGTYGHFSIVELHWLNQTPEKEFKVKGKSLSKKDYKEIIRLLNIEL